ncbi:MAG TPA: hypothetical protein VJ828_07315 [Lacipirellulaceae bacterium]|nr:hypothetical protein [Lacipirellulaceae bacterium]
MKSRSPYSRLIAAATLAFSVCIGAASFVGCERKERVLDVQTPEGSLEVDRNIDTGEVDVEVTDKD